MRLEISSESYLPARLSLSDVQARTSIDVTGRAQVMLASPELDAYHHDACILTPSVMM